MKLKTVLIIIGVGVLLIFMFKSCTSYLEPKMKDSIAGITDSKETFDFSDTDFSIGQYALQLDDQGPPVLIDDALAL